MMIGVNLDYLRVDDNAFAGRFSLIAAADEIVQAEVFRIAVEAFPVDGPEIIGQVRIRALRACKMNARHLIHAPDRAQFRGRGFGCRKRDAADGDNERGHKEHTE